MTRRQQLAAAAFLTAQAMFWAWLPTVVHSAPVYQTAEQDELAIHGGIVRRDNKATPWHFVATPNADKVGHTLVGFASVTCAWKTGELHIRSSFRAVVTAWTQPDETFARRGILMGPSIGNDDMRLWFYKDGKVVKCSDPRTWGPTANVWVGMVVTQ